MRNGWTALAVAMVLLSLVMPVAAQVSAQLCGPLYLPPASPPWDFRRDKHFLPLVENVHFTTPVETLVKGHTGTKPAPDIDYTLGRFPNHPRALISVMNLGKRFANTRAEGLPRPVECYFERGIRFAPDDLVVRQLYAKFLSWDKRQPEALKQLEYVARLGDGNPLTHRSLGLVYLEIGEYELARQQAWRLEAMEPSQTSIREALQKIGQWTDKPSAASEPASQ